MSEHNQLTNDSLGRKLREAREYTGLSQDQVADHLGMPRPSVSAFEGGKRKVTFLELKRLAALYKRPLSYFSDESSEPEDPTTAALFRTTQELSADDREHVLRFAEFLRHAGPARRPDRGAKEQS
jgi:transcriptional regulator with XRE-family HTH domain